MRRSTLLFAEALGRLSHDAAHFFFIRQILVQIVLLKTKFTFIGVYIFFLIFALKHRFLVLIRTALLRRFLRVPMIYVLSK